MAQYASKKIRTYKITVSVGVDDPSKPEYEDQMNQVCEYIFAPFKRAAETLDNGTGRLAVDIQEQPE